MKNLNRRQWLRLSTLTGAGAMLGGVKSLANSTSPQFPGERAPLGNNELIKLSSNENPFGPSPMFGKL